MSGIDAVVLRAICSGSHTSHRIAEMMHADPTTIEHVLMRLTAADRIELINHVLGVYDIKAVVPPPTTTVTRRRRAHSRKRPRAARG
jgi:hypothetical protein